MPVVFPEGGRDRRITRSAWGKHLKEKKGKEKSYTKMKRVLHWIRAVKHSQKEKERKNARWKVKWEPKKKMLTKNLKYVFHETIMEVFILIFKN